MQITAEYGKVFYLLSN